jgi:hypothetical protein
MQPRRSALSCALSAARIRAEEEVGRTARQIAGLVFDLSREQPAARHEEQTGDLPAAIERASRRAP